MNKQTPHKKNKKKTPPTSPSPSPKPKLFAKCDGRWFEELEAISVNEDKGEENAGPLFKQEFLGLEKNANNLFNADVSAYTAINKSGNNKSDFKWTEKMMKTGTLPDRMAAFIVRIQDSPVHNLHYLQQLISMVKVQGKQQCLMTAETLRDLFLEDLLPPERKLIPFNTRTTELRTATKKQLIIWIFEDRLKNHYASYIEALKKMAGDNVEKLRGKAIAIMHQLLTSHPEQEEALLQVLVNKLGDPHKKLGSRALFCLNKLLEEHPRMKLVVVEEVERLIFRNNIAKRAQYYGICFLNLMKLKDEHASLAHKLITIYVAFFKASVKTGDIDTKMMSGLLTGINRAFPQAREYGFQFTENLDTLYKIVQISQFTISVQALCILFQITDVVGHPEGADRFFRVLYEKLLTPEFLTSAHNVQFLNLILKATKGDNNPNRVTAYIKRLLQISQNAPANLACAILLLISEIIKVHPTCFKLGNLSENEIHTNEHVDASDSEEEILEVSNRGSDLQKLMKSSNITANATETIDKSNKSKMIPQVVPTPTPEVTPISTNEANLNSDIEEVDVKPDVKRIITEYSPIARNPAYCGAELTLCYEITALAKHFHPSVALFAQTLLKKKAIKYDGDPMRDFTLTRFLERFSYRNAKISKSNKHPEYQPRGLRNLPVNSESYLQTEEDNIPVEEKFFYRFFKTKKGDPTDDANENDDDSDAESVGDDEFDDMMKNYFKTAGALDVDESDEENAMEDENDIDYASGFTTTGKGKKRKQDEEESENEEDEGDEDSEDADDDADDFISMDNDEEIEFDDSGEEMDLDLDEDEKPMMQSKRKSKKYGGGEDLFVPAEEFAEMLEDNADEGLAGSHTLINKDSSDRKQLKWEMDKDRWMKGYTNNSKKSRNFNKKAKSFKNKKFRK